MVPVRILRTGSLMLPKDAWKWQQVGNFAVLVWSGRCDSLAGGQPDHADTDGVDVLAAAGSNHTGRGSMPTQEAKISGGPKTIAGSDTEPGSVYLLQMVCHHSPNKARQFPCCGRYCKWLWFPKRDRPVFPFKTFIPLICVCDDFGVIACLAFQKQ